MVIESDKNCNIADLFQDSMDNGRQRNKMSLP